MKNKRKRLILLSRLLFVVYLFATLYFTVLSERFGRCSTAGYRYNLEPFMEIKRFYRLLGGNFSFQAYLNLFGNILCFIPFGIFLPVLDKKLKSIVKISILTIIFSLTIETLQLLFKIGIFDVDDLILNTLGGICGYIIYYIYEKIIKKD